MIQTDADLARAQDAVLKLKRVLVAARKAHSSAEYRLMSAPILLEIQQREHEILLYLSESERQDEDAVAATSLPA